MLTQDQFKTSNLLIAVKVTLLALLFFVSTSKLYAEESTSTTTVYKVTKPDGSISYSDQPQSNAVTLEVEPVPTIPALKPSPISFSSAPTDDSFLYQSLVISAPIDRSALHSGTGDITVSTILEPSLRAEDKLRFLLDGAEVALQKGASLLLTSLNRGTHTITVQVIDPQNKALISASSQFTVHRPIARAFKIN